MLQPQNDDFSARMTRRRQNANASFFMYFCVGFCQKVQPRVRMCLLTSNDSLMKILRRCTHLLGSYLIIDISGLTTKISPHGLQMDSAIKVSEADLCEKFVDINNFSR